MAGRRPEGVAAPAGHAADRGSGDGNRPTVDLGSDVEDMGSYTRQRGWVETEPDVRASFWLLTPKVKGPHPLAITPHGHEHGNTYVGIWHNARMREQVEGEDQDVAVQAVERGFVTIAPATDPFS